MKQPVYSRGTIVAGKYRIDKAIARGGCSIVYRGTHIEMERPVALKIMSTDGGPVDKAWTQRFQREARLASQLRHPNTIIIYDYGHDQGLWYITMEWVPGASLRNAIKDNGPIDPQRTGRLTVQMLQSLAEAHKMHILHRDLKPSNIMLTTGHDGQEMVKVLDFGLAKADPKEWESAQGLKLTRDGDFVGTPRYASPEQLRGRELTRASDIYGMGMVMWEMLTGAPAVPEIDYATCVDYHLSNKPWALPPGNYPPGLTLIVERALAKDPAQRFQTCEEMLGPLMRWLRDGDGVKIELFDDRDVFDEEASFFDDIDPSSQGPPPMDLNQGSEGRIASRRGQGTSSHGSERPTPNSGRRRRPEWRKRHSTGANEKPQGFAAVHERDLQIDRTRSTVEPPPSKRQSTQPVQQHQRGGDSSPQRFMIMVAAGVFLLIAVGGAGMFWLSQEDAPKEAGAEDSFIAELKEKEAAKEAAAAYPEAQDRKQREQLRAAMATRTPEDLMVLLRHDKWRFVQKPEALDLNGVRQTTLRVQRRNATVDLTFYEVEEVELAKELEYQTESPAEAIRFGYTVVRMRGVGRQGRDGLSSLRRRFLDIKHASQR